MIINLAQPISCGNAVRLIVQPTAGEVRWRVLRKDGSPTAGDPEPAFSGPFDAGAYLVHDGDTRFLTDARLLVNGIPYHYALFWESSPGVWAAPKKAIVTPRSTVSNVSPDVQEIVRERIDMALQTMLLRGQIVLSKPSIQVMSIPFYEQDSALPVVTVLYASGSSVVHGLGEMVSQDVHEDPNWIGSQGWHSAVTLEIAAWSLNAEERNTLRRALEAAIAANLTIFGDLDIDMVEVQSVRDIEDTQSMNAPVFQTFIQLGCQVAVVVADEEGQIEDVQANVLGA